MAIIKLDAWPHDVVSCGGCLLGFSSICVTHVYFEISPPEVNA